MKIKLITLTVVAAQLSACSTPKVYTDEKFSNFQDTHKTVAILPFDVTVDPKNLPKDTDLTAISESEKQESDLFQRQLYSQFLEKYQKGKYTIKFQDIDETNVLLRRNDMDDEKALNFTKAEIGNILNVDSVISGTIKRSKPMKTGAAIASTFLLGFGASNEIAVNMSLHDSETGSLLWSYDHDVSGGIITSPEKLAKSLMKSSAKKFPYKVDN